MAKAQTFSEKVAKAQSQGQQSKCPICGAPVSYVKVVSPLQTPSGNYRFRPRMVRVCKCSNADLLGS